MTRTMAAVKVLLLALFALLSLALAAETATAQPDSADRTAVVVSTGSDAAPVSAIPSCAHHIAAHFPHCQLRRADRAPSGGPSSTGRSGCVLRCPAAAAALAAPPARAHCLAPSRSGELAISLQVFRC